MKIPAYYRNNETRQVYKALRLVENKTNAQDKQSMVLYQPRGDEGTLLVKEEQEFEAEFTIEKTKCINCEKPAVVRLTPDLDIDGIPACYECKILVQAVFLTPEEPWAKKLLKKWEKE